MSTVFAGSPTYTPHFVPSLYSILSFSLWCTLQGCSSLISTASALHGPWFPSGSTTHTQAHKNIALTWLCIAGSSCWVLPYYNLVIGIIDVCSYSYTHVHVRKCWYCRIWWVNLFSLGEWEATHHRHDHIPHWIDKKTSSPLFYRQCRHILPIIPHKWHAILYEKRTQTPQGVLFKDLSKWWNMTVSYPQEII